VEFPSGHGKSGRSDVFCRADAIVATPTFAELFPLSKESGPSLPSVRVMATLHQAGLLHIMSDIQSVSSTATSDAVPATLRFQDFGLAPEILRALSDQGYEHPTPIQAEAIPIVLQGKDVMGAAQTGTGKTAGFSLPIIQLLLAHANTSMSPARHPVRALILTPTRELADQVAENVKAYSRHTPLRSTVVFGGMDMAPQTVALRSGIEIVIATPGRLLDHVQQKTVNLSQTQILVMDEADRMLDMGFLPDLQRIINLLPKQRQNLMFSATFSTEIKKLAGSFLKDPVTIEVARSNATNDNVKQIIYKVEEEAKRDAVSRARPQAGYRFLQHQDWRIAFGAPSGDARRQGIGDSRRQDPE